MASNEMSATSFRSFDAAPVRAAAGGQGMIRQVLSLLRERREASQDRARLRRELEQYSDRGLAEMGLGRSDIEDVVHGRFRG